LALVDPLGRMMQLDRLKNIADDQSITSNKANIFANQYLMR